MHIMTKRLVFLTMAVMLVASVAAYAELQNVQVGGEVRVRGNWISGNPGPDIRMIEQRTRLNVKADFTDAVSAFIELDNYTWWGSDFRTNYLTGADGRSNATSNVSVFQSYVEADEMFGAPLRIRVGRQELSFGSEFLVGKGDKAPMFTGISFDAVRVTVGKEKFSVDAWWSKLADTSPIEEDGDVDFYGVYGSYKGVENVVFDAYWLYLRDARALPMSGLAPTELHTLGLRSAGKVCGVDFEGEVAYQFGNYDAVGISFGDDNAKADIWGGRAEVGYSFDVKCKPRIFAGIMYFGGEDNRNKSCGEPKTSVSFNRLFSNQIYSGFVDLNDDLSNAYDARIGVNSMITEKIGAMICVSYFHAIESVTDDNSNTNYLGTEVYGLMTYQYSPDLMFEAGWAHWFTGDGMTRGTFSAGNGLVSNRGSYGENGNHLGDGGNYLYLGSKLKF